MIRIKGIDPKMIANNLEPSAPIHPGEMIKEEIKWIMDMNKYLRIEGF